MKRRGLIVLVLGSLIAISSSVAQAAASHRAPKGCRGQCTTTTTATTSTTTTTTSTTTTTTSTTTTTPTTTTTMPSAQSCTSNPQGNLGAYSYPRITNSNGYNTYVSNNMWGAQ